MQRVIAKDNKKEPGTQSAIGQHAYNDTTNSATSRNTCYKNTDEGSVSNPPSPVENCQTLNETTPFNWICPKIHVNEILQHQPNAVSPHFENKKRGANGQNEKQKSKRHIQINVG